MKSDYEKGQSFAGVDQAETIEIYNPEASRARLLELINRGHGELVI